MDYGFPDNTFCDQCSNHKTSDFHMLVHLEHFVCFFFFFFNVTEVRFLRFILVVTVILSGGSLRPAWPVKKSWGSVVIVQAVGSGLDLLGRFP